MYWRQEKKIHFTIEALGINSEPIFNERYRGTNNVVENMLYLLRCFICVLTLVNCFKNNSRLPWSFYVCCT